MIAASGVRRANAQELPGLARAIAIAFYENPVVQWIFPDDAARVAQTERLVLLELRKVSFHHGHCYVTRTMDGGAIWFPPQARSGALDQVRMLPGLLSLFGRGLPRALRIFHAIETVHPSQPHYYLEWLGVAPGARDRGAGAALMQPVLEICDREGLPAYLEATNARARPLYLRHGFEVTAEHQLPDGGPPFWSMWREPAAP